MENQVSSGKGTVEIILQFAEEAPPVIDGKETSRETSAIDEVYCYVENDGDPVWSGQLYLSGSYFQGSIELDEDDGYSVYIECYDGGTFAYSGFQDNITILADEVNTVNITLEPGTPADPSNLDVYAIDENSMYISWQDNAVNESGYGIERLDPGGSWTYLVSVGADVTYYQDDSCNPNTEYYYRVYAYNNAGYSNYSNDDHDTTPSGSGVTMLMEDGFEGYTLWNFPSYPWYLLYDGSGASNQYVSNEDYFSGSNCLRLESFSSWPAIVTYTLPSTPNVVFLEAYIKISPIGSLSYTSDLGQIGFINSNEDIYANIVFWNDGAYFGGNAIGTYFTDQWYQVRIKWDSGNKLASLWVDGTLEAQNVDFSSVGSNYDAIYLAAGTDTNIKCLFDDVKVWHE